MFYYDYLLGHNSDKFNDQHLYWHAYFVISATVSLHKLIKKVHCTANNWFLKVTKMSHFKKDFPVSFPWKKFKEVRQENIP